MPNYIEWIIHKDKELLYVDFSGLHGKEFEEKIIELGNFVVDSGKESIHELVNITNSYVYDEVFKEAKKTTKIVNNRVEKVAIVGSTIVQMVFIKVLRNTTHINLKTFDSMENAKNWLVNN